ncbi:hypothetical protein [Knoellia aerolata]|uniref:Gram-positive cocci surface proteins LPxTG domain-containing protein n=1 Tax=Knoellia aerolata DSM 18566 TaxID=1385519 RepID=A0A0A0JWT2_9MICO|nr:hypothetical protein [Knoellia aerolata]KGN41910.1 hypothetical protein N801_04290 [Knoellia aerolata DSM 18566]
MSTMIKSITRGAATAGVAGLLSLGLATSAFADPPTGSDANQAENWEPYLVEEGYVNPECSKLTDGFEGDTWISDGDYALVVLKYATENEEFWEVMEGDELMTATEQGISHIIVCTADMEEETPTPTPTSTPTTTPTSTPTTTPTSTPTSTPTTTPTSTPTMTPTTTPTSTPTTTTTPVPPPSGPVVETDVPATSGGSLPIVAGGAAVLAGLGLAAAAMRRKGQH